MQVSGLWVNAPKRVPVPIEWSPPMVTGNLLLSNEVLTALKMALSHSLTIALFLTPYWSLSSVFLDSNWLSCKGWSISTSHPNSLTWSANPDFKIYSGPNSTPPLGCPPEKGAQIILAFLFGWYLYSTIWC